MAGPAVVWEVYFDGLCEPTNPGGVMSWGWAVVSPSTGEIFTGGGAKDKDPGNTNNQAEYFALGFALAALRQRFKGWIESPDPLSAIPRERYGGCIIRGDSKLVVEQVNGRWRVNSPKLGKLHARCLELLADLNRIGPWAVEWVPRGQNLLADKKSREEFKKLTGYDAPERKGKDDE